MRPWGPDSVVVLGRCVSALRVRPGHVLHQIRSRSGTKTATSSSTVSPACGGREAAPLPPPPYTQVVRFRVEWGETSEERFIHVQTEPLEVGETFFHPPAGAPGKAGHGFYKVSSVLPPTDDADAVVKAIRLETTGP